MSVLEGIRNDLKQHRNLDIYLTIVTALIVSALSFFDLVPAGEVTSLLLAVLAVCHVPARSQPTVPCRFSG
jgi:hypothetical protein